MTQYFQETNMKAKFSFLTMVICAMLSSVYAEESAIKAEIETLADNAATKLSESGGNGQTIAIANFDNKSPKATQADMGHAVAEVITERFKKANKFVIIENRQINKIVSQLEIEQTGLYDSKKTASVGNLVGAQFMIVGSVTEIGGFYNVTLRVVKIETGEVFVTESKVIPTNVMDSVAELYKPAAYRILLGAGLMKRNIGNLSNTGSDFDVLLGLFYQISGNNEFLIFGDFQIPKSSSRFYEDSVPGVNALSVQTQLTATVAAGYAYRIPITRIFSIKPAATFGYQFAKYGPSVSGSAAYSYNSPILYSSLFLTFLENNPVSFWLAPGFEYAFKPFGFVKPAPFSGTDNGSIYGFSIRAGIMVYI